MKAPWTRTYAAIVPSAEMESVSWPCGAMESTFPASAETSTASQAQRSDRLTQATTGGATWNAMYGAVWATPGTRRLNAAASPTASGATRHLFHHGVGTGTAGEAEVSDMLAPLIVTVAARARSSSSARVGH